MNLLCSFGVLYGKNIPTKGIVQGRMGKIKDFFKNKLNTKDYVFISIVLVLIIAGLVLFLYQKKQYKELKGSYDEMCVKYEVANLEVKNSVSMQQEIIELFSEIDILKNELSDKKELLKEVTDELEAIYAKEEAEFKAYKERLFGKKVVINVCGNSVSLEKNELKNFFNPLDATVEQEKLEAYVDSLKKTYDTYGVKREFTTSTGKQIEISGGDYGWMIDKEGTIKALEEALLKEESVETTVVYKHKGQRTGSDELRGNYVEISIPDQKIWMYINGQCIIDDDCCTGDLATNCGTRTGMFCLSYKQMNCTLRGTDYEEKVSYWMPYDKHIGIHDATWRTEEEFGGTVYKEHGSHGCVNLKLETAALLYENLQSDTPIIVY